MTIRSREANFSKCFPSTRTGVFNFYSEKNLRFRDGLVWMVGQTVVARSYIKNKKTKQNKRSVKAIQVLKLNTGISN